jgi:enoyl-CoA hydratase
VRLARLVGRGQALELILGGGMIDADTALRIGLVNRIVPAETLLSEAITLLRTILAQGPLAVRLCLEAVDCCLDLPIDEAMAFEAKQFGLAVASADRSEGAIAFLEKRPAHFTGH